MMMYKGLFQDFSFTATSSLAYSSPSTTGCAPKTQQLNTNSLVHCLIKVVSKDSLRETQLKMVFSLLTTLTLSSECRNIMFKVFYSIFNFFFNIRIFLFYLGPWVRQKLQEHFFVNLFSNVEVNYRFINIHQCLSSILNAFHNKMYRPFPKCYYNNDKYL